MPGCAVDGAVLLGKILCVADPSVGISHQTVGRRIGEGQPAEDVVIWGRGLLPDHPLGASSVIREGHHKLPTLEVTTQHEGHLLHPCYQSSGLQGNLQAGGDTGKGMIMYFMQSSRHSH